MLVCLSNGCGSWKHLFSWVTVSCQYFSSSHLVYSLVCLLLPCSEPVQTVCSLDPAVVCVFSQKETEKAKSRFVWANDWLCSFTVWLLNHYVAIMLFSCKDVIFGSQCCCSVFIQSYVHAIIISLVIICSFIIHSISFLCQCPRSPPEPTLYSTFCRTCAVPTSRLFP